jgi:hypothetical protein
MIQRQSGRVVITTPKGRVIVARRLYERLEVKMQPDDLGLLRDYDWWRQLSELINGIQVTAPGPKRRAAR